MCREIVICMREINAILGLCKVFRRFNPSWVPSQKLMWTCLTQPGCMGLAMAALEQSLAMCLEVPQKRQMLLSS